MENAEQTMNRRDVLKAGTIVGAMALGGLLSPMQAASKAFKTPTRDNPLLLNSNENLFGFSPLVSKALQKNIDKIPLYPFMEQDQLRSDLASMYRLKEDRVIATNGASAALQASLYAMNKMAQELELPFKIITANPTFELVENYAKPLGIEISSFNLNQNFNYDIDSMKESERQFDGMSLVYICNPHNPTGNIIGANDLYSWIRNAKPSTVFLLDESYAEYVIDASFKSGIDALQEGMKNIIVVRSFSKIYGLAGLRVGYILTSSEYQRRINEFVEVMGINRVGAVAASAAMKDFNFRQYCVNSNVKSKQIVTKALDSLGLQYAPSQANFIFHEITGNFDDFVKNMRYKNIVVARKFSNYDNFCRVTLGTPDQMQYYVKVLKEFRQKRYI